MGARRKSRELALKALYCMDMLKNESSDLLEPLYLLMLESHREDLMENREVEIQPSPDSSTEAKPEKKGSDLLEQLNAYPESKEFYHSLITGVLNNKPMLDETIESLSSNWKISRMGCVDRNILRIAAYELLFCRDTPAKVVINEAIEIGKIYGTEDSGAFINGILDSVYRKTIE